MKRYRKLWSFLLVFWLSSASLCLQKVHKTATDARFRAYDLLALRYGEFLPSRKTVLETFRPGSPAPLWFLNPQRLAKYARLAYLNSVEPPITYSKRHYWVIMWEPAGEAHLYPLVYADRCGRGVQPRLIYSMDDGPGFLIVYRDGFKKWFDHDENLVVNIPSHRNIINSVQEMV